VAIRLILLEAAALFMAACAPGFLWHDGGALSWAHLVTAAGHALAVCLCSVMAFYYTDLYDLRIAGTFTSFARRLPQAVALAVAAVVGLSMLVPAARGEERPLALTVILTVGMLLPIRALVYRAFRSSPFVERVLILGSGPLAQKLVAEIEARPGLRYAVVGVIDDGSGVPSFQCRHLGSVADLPGIAQSARPHRIVVALAPRRGRMPVQQLLDLRARGVVVESDDELYERLTGKLAIEALTPSSLIFCKEFRIGGWDVTLARMMSMAVALVGLVIFAPLLGLIAAAIYLDSGRPIFFVRDRVGVAGTRFDLFKFRTMHPAQRETSQWVRDNGDRITRVGKWLRKFRLDELPQFINVLRGEMNLVGPRPHPMSNYPLFMQNIPYYSLRCAVRPGITGWAQVRYGYANNLEEEIEKMRYDLYYIKHMSLWLDLRILFDTVKIVLLGRGASAVEGYPSQAPMGAR
jgi:exopolysaccharide biosynthesis polyprenyl glycosylphosphotransferase